MKIRTHLAFLLACFTAPLFAQMAPPKPQAEHQKLATYAGKWTCGIEMVGEDGKPANSKGSTVVKVGPGGLWIIDEFEGELMGAPFTGHGLTGYDAAKKKYVGTWVDSWTTSPMAMEGSYDASGKVLTMTGTGTQPDGTAYTNRMVTTDKDANTRVFEMFGPGPDGKEMKMMTITYTRAGGAPAKGAAK